jgi:hypothetical protein
MAGYSGKGFVWGLWILGKYQAAVHVVGGSVLDEVVSHEEDLLHLELAGSAESQQVDIVIPLFIEPHRIDLLSKNGQLIHLLLAAVPQESKKSMNPQNPTPRTLSPLVSFSCFVPTWLRVFVWQFYY